MGSQIKAKFTYFYDIIPDQATHKKHQMCDLLTTQQVYSFSNNNYGNQP